MRAVLILALTLAALSVQAAPPSPLTEAEVRGFMQEIDAASRARDLKALERLLSPDCKVLLESAIGGEERTTRLSRAEYLDLLERGFAGIHEVERYDYQSSIIAVALSPDGRHATVTSEVNETAVIGGQEIRTESTEATTLERGEAGLAATQVLSRTRGRP